MNFNGKFNFFFTNYFVNSVNFPLAENNIQAKFTLDFSKDLRQRDYDFSDQARQELGLDNIEDIYQQAEELSITSLPPHDLRLK